MEMKTDSFLPERGSDVNASERKTSFDLHFYVTDHSADHPDTGDPKNLEALYGDIQKDGIKSVRYDWHWNKIEPERGTYSQEHLNRYRDAKSMMHTVGLQEPTIILSNPPEWAKDLYRIDKEKFFQAFRDYAEQVRDSLSQSTGEKVSVIQILNELNNDIYTPVHVEDIPRFSAITREVFKTYNPNIKLMGTVIASNTIRFMGTPIEQYLPELKKIKDSFDIIAVDYYPGMWHHPASLKDYITNPRKTLKNAMKNIELLQKVFEEISTWGKEYELGEVGMPSK